MIDTHIETLKELAEQQERELCETTDTFTADVIMQKCAAMQRTITTLQYLLQIKAVRQSNGKVKTVQNKIININ